MNEQITRDAIQLLGVDAVSSSTISLTASRCNRLWTTYYGEIIIGNVEDEEDRFKVLFDTGSSELWVPDELCQSSACLSRKRLTREGSWFPKHDVHGNYIPIIVKYLTGEMKAIDGISDVNLLNGITVKNANVGLATHIDIPILMDLPWDGILGLGFITDDQISRGSKPLLQSIQDDELMYPNFRNQFAYYVTKNGGSVTFGGYKNEYKKSPGDVFQWAPVASKGSYWAVNLLSVGLKESGYKNNKNIRLSTTKCPTSENLSPTSNNADVQQNDPVLDTDDKDPYIANDNTRHTTVSTTSEDSSDISQEEFIETVFHNRLDDTKVIIDTGTFLIYAPQNMKNLITSLNVNDCDQVNNLPTLVFTFEGKGIAQNGMVQVELEPNDYILKFVDEDGQKRCTLAITVDYQAEVFLRKYYTVFDYDQRQIGFTPSKQDID
uniref:Aspartyl protease, putative n=1 Tax=Babesia bovis TaxID=5865 RepID=A7AS01_BABBO|eukprot:XP_001610888.1 aspartyl protease [Babesia bovis T2Bo]